MGWIEAISAGAAFAVLAWQGAGLIRRWRMVRLMEAQGRAHVAELARLMDQREARLAAMRAKARDVEPGP